MESTKLELEKNREMELARAKEMAKLKLASKKTDEESKKWKETAMTKTVRQHCFFDHPCPVSSESLMCFLLSPL